jgi:hypothetical protein
MAQLHISEAELVRDPRAVLEKVRQGAEVIVERDHQPLAVLRAAAPLRRTISDCIAVAEQRDKERGHAVTLDPGFAADVEQIVRNRKPWTPSSWD